MGASGPRQVDPFRDRRAGSTRPGEQAGDESEQNGVISPHVTGFLAIVIVLRHPLQRTGHQPQPRDEPLVGEDGQRPLFRCVEMHRRRAGRSADSLRRGVVGHRGRYTRHTQQHPDYAVAAREPADLAPESERVTHRIEGPSDVTAVLALFDRRYRDLRGEDEPYASEDPG